MLISKTRAFSSISSINQFSQHTFKISLQNLFDQTAIVINKASHASKTLSILLLHYNHYLFQEQVITNACTRVHTHTNMHNRWLAHDIFLQTSIEEGSLPAWLEGALLTLWSTGWQDSIVVPGSLRRFWEEVGPFTRSISPSLPPSCTALLRLASASLAAVSPPGPDNGGSLSPGFMSALPWPCPRSAQHTNM